jgi:hypothetical protein
MGGRRARMTKRTDPDPDPDPDAEPERSYDTAFRPNHTNVVAGATDTAGGNVRDDIGPAIPDEDEDQAAGGG